MSANCSARQERARNEVASDAPWPPSFQPRNEQISTGLLELRPVLDAKLRRPPSTHPTRAARSWPRTHDAAAQTQRGKRHVQDHEPRAAACVRYWISPTIICADEQPEHDERAAQVAGCRRRASQTSSAERDPEDRRRADVQQTAGWNDQTRGTFDAARVRAGGRREHAR